jgi:hypothetical protein
VPNDSSHFANDGRALSAPLFLMDYISQNLNHSHLTTGNPSQSFF